MNFWITVGLLLCLSRAAVEESPEEQPEFPAIRDYLKLRGGSDDSDGCADLAEFVNNHYIRLRLPRSKETETSKGKWKILRKLILPALVLIKLKSFIIISGFILFALVGLSLTKSFAVVIHQDNYEYHPNRFRRGTA